MVHILQQVTESCLFPVRGDNFIDNCRFPTHCFEDKAMSLLEVKIQLSLHLKSSIPLCKNSLWAFSHRVGLLTGRLELRTCFSQRRSAFSSSGCTASLSLFLCGANCLALFWSLFLHSHDGCQRALRYPIFQYYRSLYYSSISFYSSRFFLYGESSMIPRGDVMRMAAQLVMER